MDFINRFAEQFFKANRRLKRWQRVVSLLAAFVVFVTTYAMVLPAITLDKETASAQSGLEIAASENEPESDGTVYEAEPEEEPVEETAEEPQEEAVTEEASAVQWRCTICGYEYVGEELPDDFICPICKHPKADFEKVVR